VKRKQNLGRSGRSSGIPIHGCPSLGRDASTKPWPGLSRVDPQRLTLACSEWQDEQDPSRSPSPNPPKLPPSCPLLDLSHHPGSTRHACTHSDRLWQDNHLGIDWHLAAGYQSVFHPYIYPPPSSKGGPPAPGPPASTHIPTHSFPVFMLQGQHCSE
jgi:hypothetical protein